MGLFTKKATNAVTTDNTTTSSAEHNWQTELMTDLRRIAEAVEKKTPDYKAVAQELRRIHLDYYADKLEALDYHQQAKLKNPKVTKASKVKV